MHLRTQTDTFSTEAILHRTAGFIASSREIERIQHDTKVKKLLVKLQQEEEKLLWADLCNSGFTDGKDAEAKRSIALEVRQMKSPRRMKFLESL